MSRFAKELPLWQGSGLLVEPQVHSGHREKFVDLQLPTCSSVPYDHIVSSMMCLEILPVLYAATSSSFSRS